MRITKQRYTRHSIKDSYKYLFDQNIYKRSYRGAGFKKFEICAINLDYNKNYQLVIVEMRGTAWKDSAKRIFVRMALEENIETIGGGYFTDLVGFFQAKGQLLKELNKNYCKDQDKQFWFEYNNLRNSRPELFL